MRPCGCFVLYLLFTWIPLNYGPAQADSQLIQKLRDIDQLELSVSAKIRFIDSCHSVFSELQIDSLEALCLHMKGVVYSNADNGQFANSVQPFMDAFDIRKRLDNISPIDLTKSGYWAGYHAYLFGELDVAKTYLQEIVHLPYDNEFTVRSLKQLGIIESELGDFKQAQFYIQLALNKILLVDREQQFNLYLNQSFILLGEKSRESLKQVVNTAESVIEEYEEAIRGDSIHYVNLARYYMNIALAHELLEDYQNSLKYNRLGVRIMEDNMFFDEDLVDKAGFLNNIGNTFRKLGNYPEAESALREAMAIYNKYNIDAGAGNVFDNLGELYLAQKLYDRAFACYDSSWASFSGLQFPNTAKDFPSLSNKLKLLTILRDKAEGYYDRYENEGLASHLEHALANYELADQMIDVIRYAIPEEAAHIYWREDAKELYEKAVPAAIEADLPDLAFHYMERSKALILSEAIRKSNVIRLIPDNVRDRILAEQIALSNLESDIFDYRRNQTVQTDSLQQMMDELLSRQVRFETLMDSVNLAFPQYYRIAHQPIQTSLDTLRDILSDRQVILSYFTTRENVYCQMISRDTCHFFTISGRVKMDSLIDEQYQLLTQFDSAYKLPAEEFQNYKARVSTNLFQLYKKLIEPLGPLEEEIIVVPDENITLLNFEMLLGSAPSADDQFRDYPFLIKSHTFSYSPSAFLWLELHRKQPNSDNAMSFMPDFKGSKYPALNFGNEGIRQLQKKYILNKYYGSEASLASLSEIRHESIIHFYTHALVNDVDNEFSHLILGKEDGGLDTLYVNNIYHLRIPNSLVVISACETHRGEFARGEGMISLSRAFTYAGASSMITSLWPVVTEPSSIILNNFYKHLSEGLSKDLALRKAKLSFLENSGERKLEHPYVWASYIIIGNTDPQPSRDRIPQYLYLYIGILAAALIVLYYFESSNDKKVPESV